jgi:PAP2 superfamily
MTQTADRRLPAGAARTPWSPLPLLPPRLRPAGRPRLWGELAFSVGLYVAYQHIRKDVPEQRAAALHRAARLWHLEQWLHLDPELAVNHAADRVGWLVTGMDYYYATLHFVVTLGVLVWLYARRPGCYRGARTALYTATLLALAGFAFCALAPPRFLPGQGFVDTVVTHRDWGFWGSAPDSGVSNQYAAMPSVHVIWSAWSGLTLVALARRTWVRVLGACYPPATLVVIVATANHFVTDAVAGALTLGAGFLAQRLLTGRPAYPPPPVRRPRARGRERTRARIPARDRAHTQARTRPRPGREARP